MLWKTFEAQIPEIATTRDCDALFEGDLAVIFKHSHSCAISWAAHAQVSQFMTRQPEVPVHLVSVRQQREISRHIAAKAGVQHASPQILVIRHGAVVADASHDEITADFLSEAITAS